MLGVDIRDDDIQVCHFLTVLGNPESTNIVVRFVHVKKRNMVLKKTKKRRLNCADLDLASTSPLFVNEHLCPALKRLCGALVAKKGSAVRCMYEPGMEKCSLGKQNRLVLNNLH